VTGLLREGGRDAVGLVLVGDELLLGTVADTNGAWVAATLRAAGRRLVETRVVPDDPGRIADAVRSMSSQVGVVLTSGGLGPTSDDLTREALSDVAARPLVTDETAAQLITTWYASRGRSPTQAALRMARRPASADMLLNPHGSAPGVRLRLDECLVYALPGVPAELQTMLTSVVLPDLDARLPQRDPTVSASVEVALLGESAVVDLLAAVEADAEADPDVDIAYLARPAQVSVRVSVRSGGAATLASWEGRVLEALGTHVMGKDGQTLAEVVVAALQRAGETVATAESLTGGGVAAAVTAVPGSSAVLRGGVVVYATDLKESLTDVPRRLLDERGPVDEEVAAAMAQGACRRTGATWGVATTGVAGPDPVGDLGPGTVIVAVAGPDGTTTRGLALPGDRARVRRLTVAHALDDLRRRLLSRESR
jgi:nicotinamide-nucleotide amidase